PRSCTESEFRCDNAQCIPGNWQCDHDNDCGDNSDERDCELLTCRPGFFQCDSGHCIPTALQCDGRADCLDLSDETSCRDFVFPDEFVRNTQLCLGPVMSRCVSFTGREPTLPPCTLDQFKCTNGHCVALPFVCDHNDNCGDRTDEMGCNINECKEYGTCPQVCKNTKGSYDCECASGYRKVGDGKMCEAEGMVYFTVAGKDSKAGAIKRAYIPSVDDGSNNIGAAVDLGIKYVTSPDGIAVDWVGSMLYWADRGDAAKIECSWLDGQERKVLVADRLGWPTGLSIDFTNGDRIYWSDSKESHVDSIYMPETYKNSVPGFVCCVDVRNPFSVNVFEDHVYWSTQEKGEVFRQDKFGRGDKVKLLTAGPWLTQISVYQQQRYNSMASKANTHTVHVQEHIIVCYE
ncbi:hypothetical protein XENOCAPTIV_018969, partial [Xenoophorus captivus]